MPYAPGVTDRSGEILGQGLAQFGQQMGRGLELKHEKAEETKRLRKALSALDPERKDDFEMMGLAELSGLADAIAMRRADQIHKQQLQIGKQQIRGMRQENRQSRTAGQAMGNLSAGLSQITQGQAPSGPPQPDVMGRTADPGVRLNGAQRTIDPAMFLELARRSGVDIESAAKIGQALQKFGVVGSPVDEIQKLNADTARLNAITARLNASRTKPEDIIAPINDWILTDDDKEFAEQLRRVGDPQVRDAIIEVRRKFNSAMGRTDDFMDRLEGMLGNPSAESSKPKPASKARKYNPETQRIE
jgi:hypothetical protein